VTDNKVPTTSEYQNFSVDSEINKNGRDVTREMMEEGKNFQIEKEISVRSDQVFIVHGHDSEAKLELARMIENDLGLKAIILHEQPNKGNTIIEKFERVSEKPGYAFVLLSPDDIGGETGSEMNELKPRARQNVILELGYFLGRLGRDRVCCLYRGGVEVPSDFSGVLYLEYSTKVSERYREIRQELSSAGYEIKK
jgi:predicted nucleotide-binding protein